jgi:hypothetical protein
MTVHEPEIARLRKLACDEADIALLCLPDAGHANANTYFKCEDARGAVTVQQTACTTNSAQEEEKVCVPGTQARPPAATHTEESSPVRRWADDTAKPRNCKTRD